MSSNTLQSKTESHHTLIEHNEQLINSLIESVSTHFHLTWLSSPVSSSTHILCPPTKLGVSIRFLNEFMQICNGSNSIAAFSIRHWTTKEVCEKIIKPLTSAYKLSLTELLYQGRHYQHDIGKANAFICHDWDGKFVDLVSALSLHFHDSMDTIVWLDIFCECHHGPLREENAEWWMAMYSKIVEYCSRTVLVLSPWQDPQCVKKVWCVWQLYVTMQLKQLRRKEAKSKKKDVEEGKTVCIDGALEIALSEDERQKVVCDLKEDCIGNLNKMRACVDVSKIKLIHRDESIAVVDTLLNAIRKESDNNSIDLITSRIVEKLLEFIITLFFDNGDVYVNLAESGLDIMATTTNALVFADVSFNMGDTYKAQLLYEKCYDLRRTLLGREHPTTIKVMHKLVFTYLHQHKFAKAREVGDACYSLCSELFGETHADTLKSMNNLGIVCLQRGIIEQTQGCLDEALSLLEKCYRLRNDQLGKKHIDTLFTMSNLACVYHHLKDCDKAPLLYEQCFELQKAELGYKHPHTLLTMSNLSRHMGKIGLKDRERWLCEQCFELHKASLLLKHPQTLTLMHRLSKLYVRCGNKDVALSLYEQCLQLRLSILGEQHSDSLATMHDLASLYHSYSKSVEKALSLYQRCYRLRAEVLGEANVNTLHTMCNLSIVLEASGDHDGALELQTRCYKLRKEVLGTLHPDTKRSMSHLREMSHFKQTSPNNESFDRFLFLMELKKLKYGENDAKALEIIREIVRHDTCHSFTADTPNRYVFELDKKNMNIYEKYLELKISEMGKTHVDTLTAMHDVARIYWSIYMAAENGDMSKAQIFEFSTIKPIQGTTLDTNESKCFRDRSVQLYEECLKYRLEVLGENHSDTLETRQELEDIYKKNESRKRIKGLMKLSETVEDTNDEEVPIDTVPQDPCQANSEAVDRQVEVEPDPQYVVVSVSEKKIYKPSNCIVC